MANIIGVKFRSRGKLVYCDAGELSLHVNDHVVVDTGRGLDVAKVVTLEARSQPGEQLTMVVRQAEAEDLEEAQRNLEKEALNKCNELAGKLNEIFGVNYSIFQFGIFI